MSIALYEDSALTTEIIASRGQFKTVVNRLDDERGSNDRMVDGTLVKWKVFTKGGWRVVCSFLKETDRDTLQSEKNLDRVFYFVPDVENKSTTAYAVRWVNPFQETPNDIDDRYMNVLLMLKEE
jgi:hypothetical protein